MSAPTAPVTEAEQKEGKGSSCDCPTSCGVMILGRDPHPLCIVCIGAKYIQASLADPQVCANCSAMPAKILEKRLSVAVRALMARTPSMAALGTAKEDHADHQSQLSWADTMEEVEPIPPHFESILRRGEDNDTDDEAGSDILDILWTTWRNEDDSTHSECPDLQAELM